MTEIITISLLLLICVIVVLTLLAAKKPALDLTPINLRFEGLDKSYERLERSLREEIKNFRDEMSASARQDREESHNSSEQLRNQVAQSLKDSYDSIAKILGQMTSSQKEDLKNFQEQLGKLTQSIETKLENLRLTVEEKLKHIQEDNSNKLEQMRRTVEEKLEGTLEKRLGESFKQVSERLEQVHKGLGEMQTLASGVGDLKKVLTNVKTRGTWGEIQLSNLIEQLLTREQYELNVKTRHDSSDMVEFAIKLPGREDDNKKFIWLPIDSKFPLEDYQRLVAAQDSGAVEQVMAEATSLENRIKACAKDIQLKYIDPPNTTDFAVMFLPVEGLYAEVLRRPGLVEMLQQEYHVVVTGPTTFAALLNSLQMGFKTLAIEKRSSEVWALLGAVKTQFGKFGEVLAKVKKNIETAGKSIESAASKTRTIERKLRDVEALQPNESEQLIGQMEDAASDESEEENNSPQ